MQNGSGRVILNVYDIASPRFNKFMYATGLSGIYHSAIQVYDKEWTFLGHPFTFSGVYCTEIAATIKREDESSDSDRFSEETAVVNANHQCDQCLNLTEAIHYGTTKYTEQDVEAIIMSMGLDQFKGCDYNLIHHNCNHFSAYLLSVLIPNAVMPGWVNRLARITRPFAFVDKFICDKVRRGYFILEMLYVAFIGDVEAVRTCLGENFKIKHLQAAIDDGVNHGRIPKALPFYPVLSNSTYRKAYKFLNLAPIVSANKMQREISINALMANGERFYEHIWKIFNEIKEKNETFIRCLSYPPISVHA